MSEDNVLKSKVDGGANRQMADNETVRLAPMLMQEDDISQVFFQPKVDQVFHHVGSPVDPFGVGDDNCHFFEKLEESAGRVAGGGHQYLRVSVERVGVFVIDVRADN